MIAASFCASMALAVQAQSDALYTKPLATELKVTGSFAELRANHFHSGVDFGTSGVTGIDVYAADEGYVSRVKVSAFGYGKALYITHPDGRTTVYAHLREYNTRIAAAVEREQYRQKQFEIDWYPEPSMLRVRRGEVVAKSGNTGSSGGPHLHFEVRDTKTEEPLNPLVYLSPLTDNVAPQIYGVKLYALGGGAQVAGRAADKYFGLEAINGKTIDVWGEVGCGVHATDFMVRGGRPLGIVEVRLWADDHQVFHMRLNRFSFDETRYVNSHIDYAERQINNRFVQKSFVDPGNKLRLYDGSGLINVAEGKTVKMKYEVLDLAGNTSTVSFALRGHKAAVSPTPAPKGTEVDWRKTWALDTLGMSVMIPRESFYKTQRVKISKATNATLGDVYTIGDKTMPLHKAMTVTLPIPEKLKGNTAKAFVAQIDDKNRPTCLPGTMEGNSISGHTKTMGRFAVMTDIEAPRVVSKNTRTQLQSQHQLMVGITDNLSGIKTYNCYVDGVWKLFEYDYKKAQLRATVGKLDITRGKHTLKAVVEDAVGNVGTLVWDFSVE